MEKNDDNMFRAILQPSKARIKAHYKYSALGWGLQITKPLIIYFRCNLCGHYRGYAHAYKVSSFFIAIIVITRESPAQTKFSIVYRPTYTRMIQLSIFSMKSRSYFVFIKSNPIKKRATANSRKTISFFANMPIF